MSQRKFKLYQPVTNQIDTNKQNDALYDVQRCQPSTPPKSNHIIVSGIYWPHCDHKTYSWTLIELISLVIQKQPHPTWKFNLFFVFYLILCFLCATKIAN